MTREDHPGQAPLIRIAAPPGTGKSAVLPHLVARAHGAAVVADIDEILEQGHLLGVPIADPAAAEAWPAYDRLWDRSEEHTSELQSRGHLVCRLLLEKKKKKDTLIDQQNTQ